MRQIGCIVGRIKRLYIYPFERFPSQIIKGFAAQFFCCDVSPFFV
jgi:hypothetical protein